MAPMMTCPDCGKKMPVGGTCPNCGYSAKGGGKKAPPSKKPAPGKAPTKKGKVPPQFQKGGRPY